MACPEVLSKRLVFVIAVNGLVGGLNAEVYTAVPFTTRKSEMFPGKYPFAPSQLECPILVPFLSKLKSVVFDVTVPSQFPFTNKRRVPLSLVRAT